MRIQTLSIVCGGRACNARCPFCVSKMTPTNDLGMVPSTVNWNRFQTAMRLANKCDVTMAMITSKGESLIWKNLVYDYIKALTLWNMPLIELQTNGILLDEQTLYTLSEYGLTTVCVSCVSYKTKTNQEIYSN